MTEQLLLSVQDALITFGKAPLFEDLTFHVHEGDRIAVVGKNGAGKSTMMNMISGKLTLDMGERWKLAGTSIGMMRQDVKPKKGQTVRDYVFEGITAQNADELSYLVDMVITPLDLEADALTTHLSGGQMRRTELARALVEDPDILLLDEPTNHLDLDVIEWLENFLNSRRGTLVCISHDKTFLANITNKVFWLDRGEIKVSPDGFAKFDEWSTMLLEQEERELKNRQKKLDIEVEWASRGVKARRKRNQQRLENMRKERDALKKDTSAYRRVMAKIKIDDIETENTSKNIAEFYNVSKGYGEKVLLDKLSMKIQRGDRIGIIGKNGSGKTTFLKTLIGDLEPDEGTVKLKKDIEFSYFDQKRKELNDDHSLWKTLSPDESDYIDVMGKERHVCGYLKQFLFDPSDARNKVATLSGGQKNRLMLAKVLANPKNFLILDEPTNDLDMDTLDMLEEILTAYKGTLIVVSHDRDFLDQTVSQLLVFEGDGVVEHIIGGYSDYVAFKKRQEKKKAGNADNSEGTEKGSSKSKAKTKKAATQVEEAAEDSGEEPPAKLSYKHKYELEQLPKKIKTLESEITELTTLLKDPDFYNRDADGFMRASEKIGRLKNRLDEAETRWLELEEMKATAGE
ncbi:MAG: ABC transporter family protein [Micavibrio sp.]|nr:ABC transporter family protein [Micavibrio sp.]